MPWAQTVPIFDSEVRSLCCRPYPLHPKGCPNFGKVDRCPPRVLLLHDVFDLTSTCCVIWNTFPFGEHVARMKEIHPDWSERQLECCLYWQGTARRQLAASITAFKNLYPEFEVTTCPEAMGLNVTATMRAIGIELEWPPKKFTVQVAFAAKPRTPKERHVHTTDHKAAEYHQALSEGACARTPGGAHQNQQSERFKGTAVET
jgi:hypothetical protein